MTTTAAAVLALTVALDWLAVSRQWARVEQVAKPLVMVALGWLALTMGAVTSGAVTSGAVTSAATHPATGRLLLVAVLFSLIGDVFLLGRTAVRFAGGLVSFLVAHIAYVAAFLAQGFHPLWALPGLLVALPLGAISGRRIVRAATREGGAALGGAVTTYMVVIVAMVATAGGTARPIVLLGALIFLVSDTVLATDRFVGPRAHARIVVMVTYHLGQVLMVVGALR
jgi:uncharacterized membrane protein YhhN